MLLHLHQAFLKGDWFLSFVDVTILFQEKKTALHLSAINGHKDVCSLLVEAHAEVNALDNVRPGELFLCSLFTFLRLFLF